MTANIPRERDITRVQLWKRIDKSMEMTQGIAKEIYTQIDTIKQLISVEMANIVSENKQTIVKSKADLHEYYSVLKKDLEGVVGKSSGEIESRFSIKIKKFDERFSEMLETIPKTIYLQMEERMGHLSEMTSKIIESTEKFYDTIHKEVNKHQTESRTKISNLNNKLKSVMGKFKSISDDLS